MKQEHKQKRAREIVGVVVDFANLKMIESTQQVEGLFSKFASGRFKVIPPDEKHIQAYKQDQAKLRERLTLIAENPDAAKKNLSKDLKKFINEKVHASVYFEGGTIQYDYTVDGVEAALALGLAFVLDRNYKVGHLKQCANPDCGKFLPNLDIRARPRNTCNARCKAKADAYRKKLARQ